MATYPIVTCSETRAKEINTIQERESKARASRKDSTIKKKLKIVSVNWVRR